MKVAVTIEFEANGENIDALNRFVAALGDRSSTAPDDRPLVEVTDMTIRLAGGLSIASRYPGHEHDIVTVGQLRAWVNRGCQPRIRHLGRCCQREAARVLRQIDEGRKP